MTEIDKFVRRLKKIGIDVKLAANYPWIYLDEICNKKVTEIFMSEHAFTLAFMTIRHYPKIKFTDTKAIFKLLRKYLTFNNRKRS